MNNPFFSIIVPTYNRAGLITRTIDSLLKQGFSNFEIIVIDDGGSDNTKEVAEGFNDPRIKYFWKENAERGAARNFGLTQALGQWVNFFDSDDIAYAHHLQTAYDFIQTDPTIRVFHTSYDFMDNETGKITGQAVSKGKLNNKIGKYNSLSCNNVFMQKEVTDKYKFSEERCVAGSEDWLLWLMLIREFTVEGLPAITSTVILHQGRSMVTALGSGTEKRAECFMGILKRSNELKPFLSNAIGEFYSLAALCYSVEKKRKDAWRCSLISIKANPQRIFSRRFLATIKHLF